MLLVALILAALVAAAAGAYALYSWRRAARAIDEGAVVNLRWAARGKPAGIALIAAAVLLGAGAVVLSLRSDRISDDAPEAQLPGDPLATPATRVDRSELPFVFVAAATTGSFTIEITNPLDRRLAVQCEFHARDEDGELVFGRKWWAYDRDGEIVESDVYTMRFQMPPESSQNYAAHLEIERPVDDLDGRCMQIPPPRRLEPLPEEDP